MQARRPTGDVAVGVGENGVVPVHQHRPAAAEAEVVAAHVQVGGRGSVEGRLVRGGNQHRGVVTQPAPGGQPEGQERFRVGGDLPPAARQLAHRGQDAGGIDRPERGQSLEHLIDPGGVPGGRPEAAAQVLQQQQRPLAVVPPAQPRHELPGEDGVGPVLVAQPPRRPRVDADLGEGPVAAFQLHHPALGRRVASGGPAEAGGAPAGEVPDAGDLLAPRSLPHGFHTRSKRLSQLPPSSLPISSAP